MSIARSVALIYVRKSFVDAKADVKQASPAMQEDACLRVVQSLNLRAEVFSDAEGHNSGRTDNRPGWQRLQARMREPDVAAVIVYNWSRAVRSTKLMLALVDELDALGVRFVATDNNIDTGTAAGRFALTVISAADEYEANAASERRIANIDYLQKHKGRHWGQAPFGTERVLKDGERVLVRSTKRQPNGTDYEALVVLYETWIGKFCSIYKLTEMLNEAGWMYRNKRGELCHFERQHVAVILYSHWTYAGYVMVGRKQYRDRNFEILPGSHAPILPEMLTSAVAARLDKNRKTGKHVKQPHVHPLSRVLVCGWCGQKLYGDSLHGVGRYRHPTPCWEGQKGSYLSKPLDDEARAHVAGLQVPERIRNLTAKAVETALVGEIKSGNIDAETARIGLAVERLAELYAEGLITKDVYLAKRDAYLAQMPKPDVMSGEERAEMSVYGVAEFGPAIMMCTPDAFAQVVRRLYQRIEIKDGKMTFVAQEWCAGWA